MVGRHGIPSRSTASSKLLHKWLSSHMKSSHGEGGIPEAGCNACSELKKSINKAEKEKR